jgi:hypothetical protein
MRECLIVRSSGSTDTSSATATPDVVVTGYICYVNGELVIRAIPIQYVSHKSSTAEQNELSY